MSKNCKNKFWLENINDLFCSTNIIPLDGMSLESQMNSLTRFIIIVFIILYLLNFKNSILLLLICLFLIICLFYIQKKQMEAFRTENYTPITAAEYSKKHRADINKNVSYNISNTSVTKNTKPTLVFDRPTSYRFCNDETPTGTGPDFFSTNQKLAGKPNPKTNVAPVIVAPPADLSYWKSSNLTVHSHINDQTQHDAYRSGYQVSTCCGNLEDTYFVPIEEPKIPRFNKPPVPVYHEEAKIEGFKNTNDARTNIKKVQSPHLKSDDLVGYPYEIYPALPGQVNVSCGYNPDQLLYSNLPSNLPAGNCEQNPVFSQYNKNLFTQTVQPGIYTTNEIIEPINSNIGISFQQQFEPVACSFDNAGNIMYTELDPRLVQPQPEEPNFDVINATNISNIYDPRFSGYGTSYRAYTDENLGQTKFYYDDINSVRMPNYITRSNIDFQPFADSYGPLQEGNGDGNKYNENIRAFANDSFLRSTIQQRTELQQRLLRKQNAQGWMKRVAPIRTSGSVGSNMARR
jgi:hypothetical protein